LAEQPVRQLDVLMPEKGGKAAKILKFCNPVRINRRIVAFRIGVEDVVAWLIKARKPAGFQAFVNSLLQQIRPRDVPSIRAAERSHGQNPASAGGWCR
jgi:hypothetical protein